LFLLMDLSNGSIPKQVLRYTVPLILTALIQLLFNAADLVVVGLYCGSRSVAAVGATTSIVHLLIDLFIGFSAGVSVTVAQSVGAGKDTATHRAVHTAFPLAMCCGLFLIIIGLPLAKPGLQLMNTPADVLDQATVYMQIYLVGTLPTLLYNFGAAILHANGETKKPLVYLTVSGLANVLLNLFFVLVLDLDVIGVGLATALSQLLSAALVMGALMRRTDASRLDIKKLHFYKDMLIRILRVGIPQGLSNSLYAVCNVFVQTSINSFGTAAVAGNSAATSIGGFIGAMINNFGTTALNFAGQNFGANKYDRVKQARNWSLIYAVVFGLIAAAAAIIFSGQLLSVYITDSQEAIEYGTRKLLVAYSFYPFVGLIAVNSGTLRGLGISMPPLFISLFGIGILRMIWLFVMVNIMGINTIDVVYLTYSISWTVTGIMMSICYHHYARKLLDSFPVHS